MLERDSRAPIGNLSFAPGLVLRVAIGGLGAIGTAVACALDRGIPGLELCAVSARNMGKAEQRVAEFASKPRVVSLAELAALADVVVECAPASFYDEIAWPAVAAGRILVTVSSGALLSRNDILERASEPARDHRALWWDSGAGCDQGFC